MARSLLQLAAAQLVPSAPAGRPGGQPLTRVHKQPLLMMLGRAAAGMALKLLLPIVVVMLLVAQLTAALMFVLLTSSRPRTEAWTSRRKTRRKTAVAPAVALMMMVLLLLRRQTNATAAPLAPAVLMVHQLLALVVALAQESVQPCQMRKTWIRMTMSMSSLQQCGAAAGGASR